MFSVESPSSHSVSLSAARQQRLNALLAIRNPQQRLAALVNAAKGYSAMAVAMRTEANRVQGCLVRTWFAAEMRDGRCYFHCESDAVMLKALLGVLCDTFSGHSAAEIAADEGDFLKQIGVLHQLAENRQRTLLRVSGQLFAFARENADGGIQRLAAA